MDLTVCRICLRMDTKLFNFLSAQSKTHYEEILDIRVTNVDRLPHYFCNICAAMLQKYHKFREKCHRAQNLFEDILSIGPITYEEIKKIDRIAFNLRNPIEEFIILKELSITKKDVDELQPDHEPENVIELSAVKTEDITIEENILFNVPKYNELINEIKQEAQLDPIQYQNDNLSPRSIEIPTIFETTKEAVNYEKTSNSGVRQEELEKDSEKLVSDNWKTTPFNDEKPMQEKINNDILQSFKSKRGGVKLNVNGFIFEKNREHNKKIYWLCELSRNPSYKCKSRMTTTLTNNQEHMCVSKDVQEHNHEPNSIREKVDNAINKIKDYAKLHLNEKPCHIISDFETSTSSSVLQHLPKSTNLRQTIYRERKKINKLIEPENINFEFKKENLHIELIQEMIIIDKKYDENERIVLFTTRNLLNCLCSSKYIIMDGTFKIVPVIFQQLYTIHGCINDSHTFPMVFALCSNKDEKSYNLLFTSIKEYCKKIGLDLSPRYILMDFDKTAHNCAEQLFENANIKGCNFHLGKIIYNKIKRNGYQTLYGNNENFAIEIKSLLALAFLPESEIGIYFDDWRCNISKEADDIAKWFSQYYVWGNGSSPPNFEPTFWSTFELDGDNIPRTQNNAKSWHNRFSHFVGQDHPGFYFISQKIAQELRRQTEEMNKLLFGGPSSGQAKKKKNLEEANIIDDILKNKSKYLSRNDLLRAIAANLTLY